MNPAPCDKSVDAGANATIPRTTKPYGGFGRKQQRYANPQAPGTGLGRVEIGVLSRAVRQREGTLSHDMPASAEICSARWLFVKARSRAAGRLRKRRTALRADGRPLAVVGPANRTRPANEKGDRLPFAFSA